MEQRVHSGNGERGKGKRTIGLAHTSQKYHVASVYRTPPYPEPRLYGRNLLRSVCMASNHWILDWNVESSSLVAQLQRKSQLQQVSIQYAVITSSDNSKNKHFLYVILFSFPSYGGWTKPEIHQYKGTTAGVCGVSMDLNYKNY